MEWIETEKATADMTEDARDYISAFRKRGVWKDMISGMLLGTTVWYQ